jgi:hypothetical protein
MDLVGEALRAVRTAILEVPFRSPRRFAAPASFTHRA